MMIPIATALRARDAEGLQEKVIEIKGKLLHANEGYVNREAKRELAQRRVQQTPWKGRQRKLRLSRSGCASWAPLQAIAQ